jgi:hypothetical protein
MLEIDHQHGRFGSNQPVQLMVLVEAYDRDASGHLENVDVLC